jgi:transglutaminase-like putative cysteine protease
MKDRARLIERAVKRALYGDELPDIRNLAVNSVLVGVPDRDDEAQARAVFAWMKEHIRYVEDPAPFDLYPSPLTVWAWGAGDCDCHTILGAALLSVIGFTTGCRVIGTLEGDWHVYALLWQPKGATSGQPVPCDTTWPKALTLGDEYPATRCAYRQSWAFNL